MLESMKFISPVEQGTVSNSFALLTREISWSTLEINFILPVPHIHVFTIYCAYLHVNMFTSSGTLQWLITLNT